MTIVVAGDEAVAVHPGNAGRPQALGSRHIQLQSEIVLSVLGPPSAVCRRQALDIWAHTGNVKTSSAPPAGAGPVLRQFVRLTRRLELAQRDLPVGLEEILPR